MRRLAFMVVGIATFAACSEYAPQVAPTSTTTLSTDARAETYTQNESSPLWMLLWVPCAANGAGELVLVEGPLHILTHVTIDGRGGFHLKQHIQPQGISGFGQDTGDKYQGTGVTQEELTVKTGETYTYVNNFRIIGQGRGNNLLIHETFHVTVNANGRLTTVVDNYSVGCK